MKHPSLAPLGLAAVLVSGIGATQQVDLNGRSILDAARQLKPGEYVWAANSSSDAAGLVIVNLETQRLVLVPRWRPDRGIDRIDGFERA